MRDRLAVLASASAVFLVLAVSPYTRAQQDRRSPEDTKLPAGGVNANRAADQDKNQASTAKETIRGVVAGVTAEGEVMFDYRTNRAATAEAAFLTVVGSPVKWEGDGANRSADRSNEDRGASNRRRHNVYIVWLTPHTKICEGHARDEKAAAGGETQRSDQKRELALDNLEVGDHVEIQFTKNDDSGSTNSAHQTDQMRKKHGRHRTHVGFATEVTILPAKDEGSRDAQGERREKRDSQ